MNIKNFILLFALYLISFNLSGQTLYVPGGSVNGIGSSNNSNVGIGTSSPLGKFGIGSQEDIISSSGITLGSDQSSIEFVGSNWASGYGHKIFAEDIYSGGIINLNIAGRTNSASWNNIITFQNQGNVGIGTVTPQSRFEIHTNYTGGRIASFSTRLGYNQWNAIHIGYSEPENNYYRKAGIAFERVDVHARGKLHFINDIDEGNSSFDLSDSKMVISETGNVGIGTPTPLAKLDINGDFFLKGKKALANDGICTYIQSGQHLYFETASSAKMILTNEGKLGIGTLNPGNYLLNVAGTIRADEVIVTTGGADFVFEPEYKLPELSGIDNYIKTHKHLPDVPSATDMQINGIKMSEMQLKLLQKVEELTLYIIEQDKKLSDQELINQKLEQQIDDLRVLLQNIK